MKQIVLPTFFILGAAKAGTTSLYDILNQHPDIYFPFNKEPMFFSHDENYRRGLDWYSETYFKNSDHFTTRGEATPHYLYWSEKVSKRIRAEYNGEHLKFIVIFRDPVTRAYSWYWNMVKEGRENQTFELALTLENERIENNWETLFHDGSMAYGYFRGGCYATQLRAYLDLFPPENFFFILQEDLKTSFEDTLIGLCRFLKVDDSIQLTPEVSNPAAMPRSQQLQKYVRSQSRLKEVIKLLIPFRIRYQIKMALLKANLKSTKYPPMEKQIMESLYLRFENEIKQLERMIGRDLSHWRPV